MSSGVWEVAGERESRPGGSTRERGGGDRLDSETVRRIMTEGVGAWSVPELAAVEDLVGGELPVGVLAGVPGLRERVEASARVLLEEVVQVEQSIRAWQAWRAERLAQAASFGRLAVALGVGVPLGDDLPARSVVAEVAAALGLPEQTAGGLVGASTALVRERPVVLGALATGRLGWRHVEVLLQATAHLSVEVAQEADRALLTDEGEEGWAAPVDLTPRALGRRAQRWCERHHPRPVAQRRRAAREERCVRLLPERDGMASLHAYLPAVDAHGIHDTLTAWAAEVARPQEARDGRTLDQLRADALVEAVLHVSATLPELPPLSLPGEVSAGSADALAPVPPDEDLLLEMSEERASEADQGRPRPAVRAPSAPDVGTGPGSVVAGGGPGGKPSRDDDEAEAGPPGRRAGPVVPTGGRVTHLFVTVPVGTLLGGDEPAEVAGVGPVDAATARQLASTARTLTRILTDPVTGAVRAVDRRTYRITGALRRFLQARDGTCRFPGCPRPVHRCDVDHVQDWAITGASDPHELVHLCRHHHRLRHLTGWSMTLDRDGTACWTTPTGRHHTTLPDLHLHPHAHLDATDENAAGTPDGRWRVVEGHDGPAGEDAGAGAGAGGPVGIGPADHEPLRRPAAVAVPAGARRDRRGRIVHDPDAAAAEESASGHRRARSAPPAPDDTPPF